MLTKVKQRMSYANVMSSLAVFLVIGGGAAIAASLPKNSVGAKQLKKNAVVTKKIKNGAVTGAKVKNGTLGALDLSSAAQTALRGEKGEQGEQGPAGPATGAAGGDLTGNYPDPQIAPGAITAGDVGANALNGSVIDESSLAGVNAAQLGGRPLSSVLVKSDFVSAGPDLSTPLDGGGDTVLNDAVSPPSPTPTGPDGTVLVQASVTLERNGGDPARASCRLQRTSGITAIDVSQPAYADFPNATGQRVTIPIVGGYSISSGAVLSGVRIFCVETDGGVEFEHANLTWQMIPQ